MDYTGSITIRDDKGDMVFERDLTKDEMIEILLPKALVLSDTNIRSVVKSIKKAYVAEVDTSTVYKSSESEGRRENGVWSCCGRKGYKHDTNCEYAYGEKKVTPAGGFADKKGGYKFEKYKGKSCCGSLGFRHKKNCPIGSSSSYGIDKVTEDDESDFDYKITEGDFNDIKDLQHDEKTSVQAASELNLDTLAVIRAFSCKDWSTYRFEARKKR